MTTPPGSPPGPDAWNPPSAPASAVQVQGAPYTFPGPPPPGPRLARAALARTAPLLARWLQVGQVVLLLLGVLFALAFLVGGLALLRVLPGFLGVPLPSSTPWLLGLAALLTLVSPIISFVLLGWARELIGRLAGWALAGNDSLTPAPAELARTEQLRRTLSGWLTFWQWSTLVWTLLSLASTAVALRYGASALAQLGADDSGLTPGLEVFQNVSNLVASLPSLVLTWLILGSIKRFMNLVASRVGNTGEPPLPAVLLLPTARTLGNWFILVIVLLSLSLLNLLVSGGVLALFGGLFTSMLTPDSAPQLGVSAEVLPLLSGALGWFLPLLSGLLLLAALVVGLYLVLIALSRSYALSLAALLDAPPMQEAAPDPPPPAALTVP